MAERDVQLSKWEGWIRGPISDSVIRMYWHRQVYRELIEIAQLNQLRESAFWGYNFETYARSQAVAVRAQADQDRRSGSLARLIFEISQAPQKIDREHWLGLWGSDEDGYARSRWVEAFGGEEAEHADPNLLAPDLKQLEQASAAVKKFVDKHVAHTDWQAFKSKRHIVTLDEIDAAIDALGVIFRRYYDLLVATDYSLDVGLDPRWKSDFARALKLPEAPSAFG